MVSNVYPGKTVATTKLLCENTTVIIVITVDLEEEEKSSRDRSFHVGLDKEKEGDAENLLFSGSPLTFDVG